MSKYLNLLLGHFSRSPFLGGLDTEFMVPSPAAKGEGSIEEWIQGCIEQAKEKEDVAEAGGDLSQHGGGEPVPQTQQVIRCPAEDERQ